MKKMSCISLFVIFDVFLHSCVASKRNSYGTHNLLAMGIKLSGEKINNQDTKVHSSFLYHLVPERISGS